MVRFVERLRKARIPVARYHCHPNRSGWLRMAQEGSGRIRKTRITVANYHWYQNRLGRLRVDQEGSGGSRRLGYQLQTTTGIRIAQDGSEWLRMAQEKYQEGTDTSGKLPLISRMAQDGSRPGRLRKASHRCSPIRWMAQEAQEGSGRILRTQESSGRLGRKVIQVVGNLRKARSHDILIVPQVLRHPLNNRTIFSPAALSIAPSIHLQIDLSHET